MNIGNGLTSIEQYFEELFVFDLKLCFGKSFHAADMSSGFSYIIFVRIEEINLHLKPLSLYEC